MKLILGLGNPGPEYAWTLHNLGFLVVTALAERLGVVWLKNHLKSYWAQARMGRETVVLAQPTTFMNLSGQAAQLLLAHFGLNLQDLIAVHDDLDLPLGKIKIVCQGGAGGHRGVLSLLGALGSEEFVRVKLGIGRPPAGMHPEVFVLQPFRPEEEEDLAGVIERAVEVITTLVQEGLAAAQNRFHRQPRALDKGPENA